MLRTGTTMALAAAVLLLASCGPSINVNSDWSPEVVWESFYTYKWLPDAQSDGLAQSADQITDQRIRAAMDSIMVERGLQRVESGADLMIGYQVTTRTNVSYQTTGTSWGRSSWGRSGWSGGVTTMRTVPVYSRAGTLIISIYESEGQSLVWHGSGATDLQSTSDPRERQRRISNVVGKTLAKFPPPK
jgi:hypothetical protein